MAHAPQDHVQNEAQSGGRQPACLLTLPLPQRDPQPQAPSTLQTLWKELVSPNDHFYVCAFKLSRLGILT